MAAQIKTLTRKQRRAAGTSTEIPMAQPDRSGPQAKTLYDLAAEREAELSAQADALNAARGSKTSRAPKPSVASAPTTLSSAEYSPAENDPPILTALLYASTLTMTFFTLTLLVHHQYGQSIPYHSLLQESLLTFPLLTLLVYTAHSGPFSADRILGSQGRLATLRSFVFATSGAAAGCWLVKVGNEDAYLAVMKRAPGLGVLWIWCVIEVGVGWAVGSVGVVGGWAWWRGFGFW